MQPNSNGTAGNSGRPERKKGIEGKIIGMALVALVAFSLGIVVGDGRIQLRAHGSGAAESSLPRNLDYSSVDRVYDVLRDNYDGNLDQQKLMDGLKEGLAEATGDPYTQYFTASQYKQFSDELNGSGFSGIGAELGQDKDKNLIVVAPIAGTPAAKAGLKPQDIIAEIDGKTTAGLSIDEAVTKIRGKKGTTVKLTVIRNRSDSLELSIVRDDIKVPSVDSKMLDDTTGYMHISTFGEDTGQLASDQAKQLKDKGAKKIVLDLRGNPGGVVDSAVQVASLWLPKGKLIMQQKRGNTVTDTYTSNGNDILKGMQTVVLIDAGSASASEIVSGALHDNNAAKLIGEKSFGKGVVQGIEPLGDGGELKVTIARWYRPNGSNIDKKGIDPDQTVKNSDADIAAGKDAQLEAAQAALQ